MRTAKWTVYQTNKIPIYESQVRPAGTSGGTFIDNPSAGVNRSLENFSKTLTGLAEQQLDKEQKAKIVEESTTLQQRSLELYLDAEQNRQGKAALADEEEGREAIYDDYNRTARELVEKSLTRISPAYRDLAQQQLGQVVNGYRNKFAVFQAQQAQAHRKEVMKSNLQATETELYSTMERGGGIEEINASLGRVRELLKLGSGGADIQSQYQAYEAKVVEDSIKAAAIQDAGRALDLLKDDRLREVLDPGVITALEQTLDKQRIQQESDDIVAGLEAKQLPYEARLKVIEGITDKDVRQAAYAEVKHQQQIHDEALTRDQFNTITDYYDRIFNQGETISISAVRKDASLEFSQREKVVSWLEDGQKKALQLDDVGRWVKWTEAQDKIISGEWNATDIRKAVINGDLDIRDAKSVENDYNVFITTGGRTYSDLDQLFAAKYPTIYKNGQRRAQVLYGAKRYIDELRTKEERNPTPAEVEQFLQWSAKGIVETRFWSPEPADVNLAEGRYPMIDDPQGKLAAKGDPGRLNLVQSTVLNYRLNGDSQGRKYPRAYYDAERNWYVLGQPAVADGRVYIQTQDGRVGSVPVERWMEDEGERQPGPNYR